jgi:hypothetical protein
MGLRERRATRQWRPAATRFGGGRRPLVNRVLPRLTVCRRQGLLIFLGHDTPRLLVGVDEGGVNASLEHRLEQMLVHSLVDHRLGYVGVRIEEDGIGLPWRAPEFLDEALLLPLQERPWKTPRLIIA